MWRLKEYFCLWHVSLCYSYAKLWENKMYRDSYGQAFSPEARHRLELLTRWGASINHATAVSMWGAEKGSCELLPCQQGGGSVPSGVARGNQYNYLIDWPCTNVKTNVNLFLSDYDIVSCDPGKTHCSYTFGLNLGSLLEVTYYWHLTWEAPASLCPSDTNNLTFCSIFNHILPLFR